MTGAAARDAASAQMALRDIVAHAAAAETSDAAAARLAPLFAETGWLEALTGHWIDALRADPPAAPTLPTTRNGPVLNVTLQFSPPVRLLLTLIQGAAEREDEVAPDDGRDESISFSGMHGLYRLLSPDPVDALIAHARPGKARCRARSIRLRPGRMISLDERRFALRIAPQDRAVLLLRARIERTSAPMRRYSMRTGTLVGTVQNDDGFARSAMLLSVLRAAGAHDAVPDMIAMLDRANGRERWTVMRELLALDAQAGWPHLRRMAHHDPAPEVRAAARTVLQNQTDRVAATCPA